MAQQTHASPADLVVVRERLLASLVELPAGSHQRVIDGANHALRIMDDAGAYPDQDYGDRNRENWKALDHMPRIVSLATAARLDSVAPERQGQYLAAAVRGLRYWVERDPSNTNWWHNEIGVPMQMGNLLIMLGEDAPPELLERGVEIMRRAKWERWTGQNLVWGTKIQIARACLENDVAAAEQAFTRMWDEVRIAPGRLEGIKPDWSFYQHGELLYSGGYGSGFSSDTARLAVLARGTAFAIPPEKLEILVSYVLDGQAWMIRGHHWDYGVTGRELVRRGKNARSMTTPAADLAQLEEARKQELLEFAARIRGESDAPALVGNRDYWCSDYMVHRRPGFFASARMHSVRTRNTDGFINGENKKSHHLADGVTYIMVRGDEYEDIFPVWDWHRIPGATIEQNTVLEPAKVSRAGTTEFVGGVSDGTYGCATMDLKTGPLEARKSWFFFDEGFVALGAGINSSSGNPVFTSINQCLLKGEVFTSASATATPLPAGTHGAAERGWIWHDEVGYIPLEGTPLHVRNDEQRGRWGEIRAANDEAFGLGVFSLWIDHGAKPANAGYAYMVVPGASAEQTAAAAKGAPVRILANTPELQAVRHEGAGITQAIFRAAGRVMCGEVEIGVDRACALLVRQSGREITVTVSNPEATAADVNVTSSVPLIIDRAPTLREILVHLPEPAGASRSVSFRALLSPP